MDPAAHTILIVEDERVVARDLERRLIRFGYGVAGVTPSGEEAVQIADRTRPHLVMMDIRLQGRMDGIAAADEIRKMLDIPVVFLTAHGDDSTIRAARVTEPYGYVLKPFEERELRIVLEMALYKHATERERKRLELQGRQSEKMDAIGQLAGGIAHDFNNVLMVILTTCELLRDHVVADDYAIGQVALIRAAAERASRMTRQLMAFGRDEVAPVSVDLGVLVSGIVALLRQLIGEHIELVTSIDPALHAVSGVPAQLEQIILNLIVNARDAMPEGGMVVLTADNERRDDADWVVLSVSDGGKGMDEATKRRIFEPFFTTKDVGEGTGLGLANVYALVDRHGGRIEVETTPGYGTTFKVWIPASSAPPQRSAKVTGAPPVRPPLRGTALVVEDDAAVRTSVVGILTGAGLDVIEARDGDEALRICRETDRAIDVVLSDVVMPRMSGLQLGQQLALVRPEVKLIFMSGYPERSRGATPATLGPVLAKPFTAAQLIDWIREVL